MSSNWAGVCMRETRHASCTLSLAAQTRAAKIVTTFLLRERSVIRRQGRKALLLLKERRD